MARRADGRQIPEVGAVCLNWARTDLCGGCRVTGIPTAIADSALVSGSVPKGYAAHLTHLLDEAPMALVVMAVEDAAASEGVPPKAVWRNVSKLARSLGIHRKGLWA